ncbi:MAG TPA: radical SAM protein [Thermoanaerobaculia bacterium]|nr:radical SAM protein [Thermoanaerobaculia bacterium]
MSPQRPHVRRVADSGRTGPREEARRIRRLRPAVERPRALDRPLGVTVEEERTPSGPMRSATVFLAGAECRFTCSFCDLWRHTTEGPTPAGALPAQLDRAMEALGSETALVRQVKLYNASNFFDPRAVPDGDREAILERVERFERVVVESHPRLLGTRAAWWARRLGARLEVAIGLETAHPGALARLGKGVEPADFDRAARRLRELGVGLRCFVLVGVPHVEAGQQVEWTRRTVARAVALGASMVSLIPVRGGNGELERLRGLGRWRPPTLALLEDCLDAALAELAAGLAVTGAEGAAAVVQADPWDLEPLTDCAACAGPRLERLRAINRGGAPLPRVACAACPAPGVRGAAG